MKLALTIALSTLVLSAPSLADTVPEGVPLRAYPPVGNGDPNAISCWARRVTPPIRGLQCARNSSWKRFNGPSPNYGQQHMGVVGPPPTVWPWESYPNSR